MGFTHALLPTFFLTRPLTFQVNSYFSNLHIENAGNIGFHVVDQMADLGITDSHLLDSRVLKTGGSAVVLGNAAGWQVRIPRSSPYLTLSCSPFLTRLAGARRVHSPLIPIVNPLVLARFSPRSFPKLTLSCSPASLPTPSQN
jgi:hypothetical protein